MKNKWDIEFKKGYKVVCNHPRGGTTEGVVSSIKKSGALWQVVASNAVVQFSSLQRSNCVRWMQGMSETQEERENKFSTLA